jgi:hypothetical protein
MHDLAAHPSKKTRQPSEQEQVEAVAFCLDVGGNSARLELLLKGSFGKRQGANLVSERALSGRQIERHSLLAPQAERREHVNDSHR